MHDHRRQAVHHCPLIHNATNPTESIWEHTARHKGWCFTRSLGSRDTSGYFCATLRHWASLSRHLSSFITTALSLGVKSATFLSRLTALTMTFRAPADDRLWLAMMTDAPRDYSACECGASLVYYTHINNLSPRGSREIPCVIY